MAEAVADLGCMERGGGDGEWPKATRGDGVWGGGVPLPTGVRSGEGLCPSPEKF